MMAETLNLPRIQHRILVRLFRGSATRQELALEMDCTHLTISKAISALMEIGLVVASGSMSAAAGRHKDILTLNAQARLCLTADIGYDSVKLGLVTLAGDVADKVVLPLGEDPIVQGIPEDAFFTAIETLIARVKRDRLLGICVGISGMVNSRQGQVLFCPNIHGFDERSLAEELSARFNTPVLLDTSARCMALGESRFGAGKGIADCLFLSLGMGSIASGILAGGALYRGAEGFAGEIGHTCVRPGARAVRCSCGGYDCLELCATLSMLCKNMDIALDGFSGYSPAKHLLAGDRVSPQRLREIYASGDPVASECLDRALDDISTVLTGAVNLLTPELVILGGGLIWHLPEATEEIAKRVRASCLMPLRKRLRFTASALGENGALQGAGVLLIEQFLRGESSPS